jgi:hypothetical protein
LKEQEYVVEATGLPCGDDCKDAQENNPLKNNDSKLGVTLPTSSPN